MMVLACLVAAAGALAYAVWIEPRWIEVTRHRVIAPVSAPITLAHLTDLHTTRMGPRERRLLALLDRHAPDVIVITGDTVSTNGRPEQCRAFLSRLRAPLGVWAVRGNWESLKPTTNDRAFYESLNIRLLMNESAAVRSDLWLAGLDDSIFGSSDAAAALAGIPAAAATIALFHAPADFPAVAGKCALALAGHAHGGQIGIPGLRRWWLPRGCGSFIAGWYAQGGSRLYVSRGIGTSMLPIRFGARPELALMTLQPSETL
ncbi:MAG: metallophosphoesterase family protein [Candidatus Omnitrophica bacterium]|nr:metallophosphoesterase family protein [Candidatus Omnitrophota bacterium]